VRWDNNLRPHPAVCFVYNILFQLREGQDLWLGDYGSSEHQQHDTTWSSRSRVFSLLADGVVGEQVEGASSVDDARRGITTEYSVCYSPPAVTPAFATTYHLRRVGLAQVLLVASSNDADILARKVAKTVQPPFSCTQLRVTG